MTRFSPTERIGVSEVEKTFLKLGWIPRTIFQTDVGIDMIVEISEGGQPLGKFVGVQIKTGSSYFKECSSNSIIFRPESTHIDYWVRNSLPIIIVLHNPDENLTLWQTVNKETVESTGKNFKLQIPISNELNSLSKKEIEKLTETPPLINKFQKLLMDKPIIDKLRNGEKIVVDLERWVNKSSGRADIKVYQVYQDEDYEEGIELDEVLIQEYSVMGVYNHQSLYHIYPFADFEVDDVYYENYSEYDDDEMPGYKIVFIEDKFHDYKLPIIPYSSNAETSSYRLTMKLNDFGKSFLDFYDFVSGNKQLEIKFEK